MSKVIEYQVGEHIKMPELHFKATGLKLNDFVVTSVSEKTIHVVQHHYQGDKWTSAFISGIYKKELDPLRKRDK